MSTPHFNELGLSPDLHVLSQEEAQVNSTFLKLQADFRAELDAMREQFPSDGSLPSQVAYHLQLHQPGFNDLKVIEAIKRLIGFPELPATRAYGAIAASYYRERQLPRSTSM